MYKVKYSIPLPKLKNNFQFWMMQFQSYVTVKKFNKAIGEKNDPDLPSSEGNKIEEGEKRNKQETASAKKAMALSNLTLAVQEADDVAALYEAKTEEWPTGLAYMVIKELKETHAPDDIIMNLDCDLEMKKFKMKTTNSPTLLFKALSWFNNKYQESFEKWENKDYIRLVMKRAPKIYKLVIASEASRKGEKLTYKDVKRAMNMLYRTQNIDDDGEEDEEEEAEIGLAAADMHCYICESTEHRAQDCPHRYMQQNMLQNLAQNQGARRFNERCNICGERGHPESKCYFNPSFQGHCPQWF